MYLSISFTDNPVHTPPDTQSVPMCKNWLLYIFFSMTPFIFIPKIHVCKRFLFEQNLYLRKYELLEKKTNRYLPVIILLFEFQYKFLLYYEV